MSSQLSFQACKQRLLTIRVSTGIVVSTALVLCVGALGWVVLHYMESEVRNKVAREQQMFLSKYAESIDSKLQITRNMLSAVARQLKPALFSNPDAAQAFLDSQAALHAVFDNGLFLISQDGRIIAESPFLPGGRNRSIAHREFFQVPTDTKAPYISKPFVSIHAADQPAVTSVIPVFDASGRMIGRLHGSLQLLGKNFLAGLSDVHIGQHGYLFLSDTDRMLIVHPDRSRIMKTAAKPGVNVIYDRALEGFEGTGETVNSRGQRQLLTTHRLKTVNWILGSAYPMEEVLEPVRQVRDYFVSAAVIGVVLTLLLLAEALRRLTGPLSTLTARVEQVRARDDVAFEPISRGSTEVIKLSAAFSDLVDALAKREKRYRALVQQSPVAVIEWDLDSRVREWNIAAERIFGYARDQVAGRHLHFLVNVEDRPLQDRLREQITRHGSGVDSESRNLTADGRTLICRWHSTLLLDERGEAVGILSIVEDITEQRHAEGAQRESEEKFKNLFESAQDAILLMNDAVLLDCNQSTLTMFRCTREQIVNHSPMELSPPNQADGAPSASNALAKIHGALQGRPQVFEWRHRRFDGTLFDAEVSQNRIEIGGQAYIQAIIRDISTRKAAEAALRLRDRALESSSSGILIADALTPGVPIVYVNPAFERITGFQDVEAQGQQVSTTTLDLPAINEIHAALSRRDDRRTLRCRHRDGHLLCLELAVTPVLGESGAVTHLVGVVNDMTEHRRYEEQLEHQATHDALTGLPNRSLLIDRLQQAIGQTGRENRELAVLFVDLDSFKSVNDSLGHHAGDKLIQLIGDRLVRCLRPGDTVARVGGDEFVLIMQKVESEETLSILLQRILTVVQEPAFIMSHELVTSCSIGVAIFPRDGHDTETLLKHADTAMYRAKESGRNAFQLFTDEMNRRVSERLSLEMHLRRALERNQLTLHYQPQFNLKTGRITGVEALLRWQHAGLGMVPPGKFIPVSEETGLIIPIGEWVLRTACMQNAAWQRAGLGPLHVAVNISARQFQDKHFADKVSTILQESRLSPAHLELEITESTVMNDIEQVVRVLDEIKRRGIRLSLDDFGTGYSSLMYIKRFAIDKLKIDQSFVRDAPGDPNDAAIVAAIIAIGKTLKLTVIGEGVETEAQAEFLLVHGCDDAQGFHLGRPMTAGKLEKLLRDESNARSVSG